MQLHEDFISQIQDLLPEESASMIHAICETDPSVAIRLNSAKCGNTATLPHKQVKWCDKGYYLSDRIPFTFDPTLHQGRYYVQDASSMILHHIVQSLIDKPVRYLDLCAAPGGKTTAAIDALPEGSLMVCNEIMGNRAQILKENIIKWGNPACVVTNNDSATIGGKLPHFFDVIAADVPCSGEGMFRKDPDAVAQWNRQLVEQCAKRQREIVDNAWQAIRPGGIFIYSTCTYNRDENEEMIEYIIGQYGAESIDLKLPESWGIHGGIRTAAHCYRFLPHLTHGEGLFVAVLRKPEGADETITAPDTKSRKKRPKTVKKPTIPACIKTWVNGAFRFDLVGEDTITAMPEAHADDIDFLRSQLHVIHAGIEMAHTKGKDLIPAQSLALSTAFNADAFPVYEIGYTEAIAYLRGEIITIDAPRGIVALSYECNALGFVKNLGNRANNLYPKEWRIKSTHIPDKPVSLF